mgnify:CR=1 FL=1
MSKQTTEQQTTQEQPVQAQEAQPQPQEKACGIDVKEYLPPDPSQIDNPDPNCVYYWDSKADIEKYGLERGKQLVYDNEANSVDPDGRRAKASGMDVPTGRTIPTGVVSMGDLILTKCSRDFAESRKRYMDEKSSLSVKGVTVTNKKDLAEITEARMKDAGFSGKEIDRKMATFKGGAQLGQPIVFYNGG